MKTFDVYYFHDVIHFHIRCIQTPASRIIITISAAKTEVLFILGIGHKFIGWKHDCVIP
jgi:hypothetical protein